MSVRSRTNWNLKVLVFKERGKPEYPEKNLSEQGREPTTNSTHIWRRHRDLNPGHIGGRQVLSPLRHPCSPRQENRSNLSFTARIITKYSLKRFLSICGEKMSKGFLKICKLITNLILGQIIVSNLTNVRKQNSRINDARLH